jgi:hypothetical protein
MRYCVPCQILIWFIDAAAAATSHAAEEFMAPATMKRLPLGYLAAAHPVAYANLVDCCIRQQHYAATEVIVAAEVLGHAFSTAAGASDDPDQDNVLANPAAVEALAQMASALVSVVKKAVVCIKAAGSMQNQPRPSAGSYELGEYCFAAAAPAFTSILLQPAAAFVSRLAKGDIAGDAGNATSSSSAPSTQRQQQQQHMPSLALLAVLLARSLVVLADALEAAAEAAGSTAPQLFAR